MTAENRITEAVMEKVPMQKTKMRANFSGLLRCRDVMIVRGREMAR